MANLLNMSGGSLLKKRLPYDYEVEWIQSNNSSYINTGIKPKNNTSIYVDFIYEGNKGYIISSSKGWLNGNFSIYCPPPNNVNIIGGNTNTTIANDVSSGQKLCVYFDSKGNCTVNGDSVLIPEFTGFSNNNFTMFCDNRGYTHAFHNVKIHEVIIKEDIEEVRHFLSVVKDNVACMYDKVSETFFYNVGTGDFIAGPRVS